jgi:hypothetical protein
VRRAVDLADVRLDFDDPTRDPTAPRVVGDEPAAEQSARRLERRAGEQAARERRAGGQGRG